MLQYDDRVKKIGTSKNIVEVARRTHEMKVDVRHASSREALPGYAYVLLRNIDGENSLASPSKPKGRATQPATIIDAGPVFWQTPSIARKVFFQTVDLEAPGVVKTVYLVGSRHVRDPKVLER